MLLEGASDLQEQLIGLEFVAGGDFVDGGLGEFGDFSEALVDSELCLGEACLDGLGDFSVLQQPGALGIGGIGAVAGGEGGLGGVALGGA